MEARVVYFDGCPNWQVAGERLRLALDQSGHRDVPISWTRVDTEEQAIAAGFAGSPTILVDGEDVFASGEAWTGGLACRLYWTSHGPAGAPTVEDLIATLAKRGDGR